MFASSTARFWQALAGREPSIASATHKGLIGEPSTFSDEYGEMQGGKTTKPGPAKQKLLVP